MNRLTRRRVAAAAVLLALGASSCTTDEPSTTTRIVVDVPTTAATPSTTVVSPPPTTRPPVTTTAAPTGPSYGGVVTVGTAADLVFPHEIEGTVLQASLNPLLDGPGAPEIARLVVPGAYRIDSATGELTPWLVADIPRPDNGGVEIAGDGTVTVTYRIRDRAVWADGTPITAADLAFTHELIVAPAPDVVIDSTQREIHDLVEAGSLVAEGKTLSLRLVAPTPRYERLFEFVVPAHAVDPASFGTDWNETLWMAGGPFRFVSYEPPADPAAEPGLIRLERNDMYWERDPETGGALPYLDGIDLRTFTPGAFSTGIATWFTTGSVDAFVGSVIPPQEQGLLGDPDASGFEVAEGSDALFEMMVFELGEGRFDVNPDSLNEHLDYRRAVLSTIDRADVAAESGELPVSSILGIAIEGLDHDAWSRYDDPSLASTLLDGLGEELGRDFAAEPPRAVYVSSSGAETVAIGEAVVASLRAAGFEASTDFEGDFFGAQWPQGQTDIYAFRIFAGTGGLGSLVRFMATFDADRDENPFTVRWNGLDEAADRYSDLMAQAATELDPAALAALLTEAEAILADNALIYPLVRRQHNLRPYWPERIQGIVPNRHQGWDTWNAAWWWSPAG